MNSTDLQTLCTAILEDASTHFTAFGTFLNALRSLPWQVTEVAAAERGGFYTLECSCPDSIYALCMTQPGMEETDLPPTVEAYYLMIRHQPSGDEVLHLQRQGAEWDVTCDELGDVHVDPQRNLN